MDLKQRQAEGTILFNFYLAILDFIKKKNFYTGLDIRGIYNFHSTLFLDNMYVNTYTTIIYNVCENTAVKTFKPKYRLEGLLRVLSFS